MLCDGTASTYLHILVGVRWELLLLQAVLLLVRRVLVLQGRPACVGQMELYELVRGEGLGVALLQGGVHVVPSDGMAHTLWLLLYEVLLLQELLLL